MYELVYSRTRSAYILHTEDTDSTADGDTELLCIIQARDLSDALRTAQSVAQGPVEVALPAPATARRATAAA